MAYLYTRKQIDTPIKSNDLLNIAFNDVEYYSYISSQGSNSAASLGHYCYDLKDVLQCNATEVYELFLLFVTAYKPEITKLKNACFVLLNIDYSFNRIFRKSYEACCFMEIETNIPKLISKFKFSYGDASIFVNKINDEYRVISCIIIE